MARTKSTYDGQIDKDVDELHSRVTVLIYIQGINIPFFFFQEEEFLMCIFGGISDD